MTRTTTLTTAEVAHRLSLVEPIGAAAQTRAARFEAGKQASLAQAARKYASHLAHIREALAMLEAHIPTAPEGCHWGHVGDIAELDRLVSHAANHAIEIDR